MSAKYRKDELESLRPYAVVGAGGEDAYDGEWATSGSYVDRGVVYVSFEDDIPAAIAANAGEAYVRFLNAVEGIIAEVKSDAYNVWMMQQPKLVAGPERAQDAAKEECGDYLWMLWRVPWGLNSE